MGSGSNSSPTGGCVAVGDLFSCASVPPPAGQRENLPARFHRAGTWVATREPTAGALTTVVRPLHHSPTLAILPTSKLDHTTTTLKAITDLLPAGKIKPSPCRTHECFPCLPTDLASPASSLLAHMHSARSCSDPRSSMSWPRLPGAPSPLICSACASFHPAPLREAPQTCGACLLSQVTEPKEAVQEPRGTGHSYGDGGSVGSRVHVLPTGLLPALVDPS